jgi:hypothetical protein
MDVSDSKVKFGDLLVKLNLISPADLDQALHTAPQFGLPLGKTLVLLGRLSEQELQVAIELQELINQKNFPLDSAQKAVALVKSGVSPATALQKVHPDKTAEKTALGELLLEAGVIDQHQLEEAQKRSYQSGMRLGRMLVLSGLTSDDQLSKALNAQAMLRKDQMSRSQAIEIIKVACPKASKMQEPAEKGASTSRQVRFTEFLVSSGLATETEMLNAMEISLNRKLSLGETIVQLGIVSQLVFNKAVELHSKVVSGSLAFNDAVGQLHRMVFGDPEHDRAGHSPVLGELLKMSGLVTHADITEAIALANKYPSVIGKMLVMSGAIDEATLIASLRCQFMLKHGYLKVEDAVAALKYSKDNRMSFDDALEELGLRAHKQQPPH